MKYKFYDIELYEYCDVATTGRHQITNQQFVDIKQQKKSFKIFGTQEQINEYKKGLPIDEIYEYGLEEKDTYYAGISFQYSKGHERYDAESDLPTLKEYNDKVIEFFKKMEKRYIENNCQILVR
jgi:hypothetical protein